MRANKHKFKIILFSIIFLFTLQGNMVYSQEEEITSLREKQKDEKKAELAKKRKEHKEERDQKKEELAKTREEHKLEKEQSQIKREESKKNKEITKKQISNRKKEITKARWSKNVVNVITSKEDPVYIYHAKVKKAKTEFLGLNDIDLSYRVKIKNQTPKIVNQVQVVWKRSEPFNDILTIKTDTNVSRPLLPYKNRTIQYNEEDSQREGETYSVLISKVLFEDGTQWTNPESN